MSNKNIVWHDHHVTKESRSKSKNQKPCVLWFTGLSGSGKSTVANAVELKLNQLSKHTYILDGDNVRLGLNKGLTFSDEDRVENIRRIGEIANLFVDAGIIVLASFISPFKEEREFVRNTVGISNYFEVFVDCPIEECENRDVKGLYKKARDGEIPHFTGISSPYEVPESPDLIIETSKNTVDEAVLKLIGNLEVRFALNS